MIKVVAALLGTLVLAVVLLTIEARTDNSKPSIDYYGVGREIGRELEARGDQGESCWEFVIGANQAAVELNRPYMVMSEEQRREMAAGCEAER